VQQKHQHPKDLFQIQPAGDPSDIPLLVNLNRLIMDDGCYIEDRLAALKRLDEVLKLEHVGMYTIKELEEYIAGGEDES
jgi:hypothetical protein